MKQSTKIILPVLIIVAGFAVMMSLLALREETPKRPPEARPKVVATSVVHLQPVQVEVTAYGRAVSAQPVQLYAEVAGTIERGAIRFRPAQSFKKGDLLLKIDDRQTRYNLNSTKSDLLTALASVLPEIKLDFPDEYEVWLDYFDSCGFDRPIAPIPETGNPRIKLYLSRFGVYKLYFSVRDLEVRLEKHSIHAPFDGSIVSTSSRVGSTARAGTLMGEIINLEEMEVAVPVEVEDIQWIDRRGQVTFTSSELAGVWTGTIVRVGSDIDTRTQTVELYVAVDGGRTASLLSGVFLTARLPGRTIDSAFTIPPKAVYENRYVYLIANGVLERREVEILRRETGRIIVNGGIEDNDTLVVEIMQGVAPGMPAQSKTAASGDRGE
ncbi:MAG TPA: efflux RND transporter periplasmic adaptor subunit [Acidobacteriota bacterium]|nr:efflux RND transporter periplasmic adaptor subunit [Acidobacteriota bacterium]